MANSLDDSADNSTLNVLEVIFTTVRQAPLIAILSPIFALNFAFIVKVLFTKL